MLTYVFKTAFKNLGTKKLFSTASIVTIACSVLVYCIFFIIASNIQGLVHRVETTVGIQVFFDESLTETEIQDIANTYFLTDDVKEIKFKSSNEAWEKFKVEYFDNRPELASAFEDDNPLAHSASYEVLLNDISKQYDYVNYLKTVDGVRQINFSNVLIDTLLSINFGISSFSIVLICLLLLIAIILISNTISVASQYRKKENEIMKLIGATNFMIRAPFVIEGFLIGFFGSLIPLILVCSGYNYLMKLLMENAKFLSNVFEPIKLIDIIFPMCGISLFVACFVCMVVSSITVRRQIRI